MCDKWRNNFQNFCDWALKNGYREDLSIERKNVNLGYCEENCEWITLVEQAGNKQSTIYLTHNGITKSIKEWSNDNEIKNMGLTHMNLYRRKYAGCSDEDIYVHQKGEQNSITMMVNP
jgi:hypothetical protein